jgi:hypothetical protein
MYFWRFLESFFEKGFAEKNDKRCLKMGNSSFQVDFWLGRVPNPSIPSPDPWIDFSVLGC